MSAQSAKILKKESTKSLSQNSFWQRIKEHKIAVAITTIVGLSFTLLLPESRIFKSVEEYDPITRAVEGAWYFLAINIPVPLWSIGVAVGLIAYFGYGYARVGSKSRGNLTDEYDNVSHCSAYGQRFAPDP